MSSSSAHLPAPYRLSLLSSASLGALASACVAMMGDEGAELLRDAGFATGSALADELSARQLARGSTPIEELPRSEFIAAVSELFRESGWGLLEVDASRPALTVLDVRDWSEGSQPRGGMHFTTGVLAGFFGTIAGEELAVLEVGPPNPEPRHSRFLMGSIATVDALFARLDGGEAVSALLVG